MWISYVSVNLGFSLKCGVISLKYLSFLFIAVMGIGVGGVCIYVSDQLKVTVLRSELVRPPHVEVLWMTVQYKEFPSFIIGCIYRHPHALSESYDYISDIFGSMCLRNKPLLILGDFNDDLFLPSNKMIKIIQTLQLHQLVEKPTCITSASSKLLDIITNRQNFVVQLDVLSCSVGDHELLTATINIRKEKRPSTVRTFGSLENYSQNYFCDLLLHETDVLNYFIYRLCVNDQVLTFNSTVIRYLDTCAPCVTKVTKRPPAPWMDSELKEAMRVRDNLHITFKSNKQDLNSEGNYRREEKLVKEVLLI